MVLQQWTKRLYLFLVFLIGWGSATLTLTTSPTLDVSLTLLCSMSPLLAAFITHFSQSDRTFPTRIYLSFGHRFWWIASIFVPLFFYGVLDFSYTLEIPAIIYNPLFLLLLFFIACSHEIGWRGFFHYAIPPHHFCRASLLTGIASSCWHIPIWLIFFSASNSTLLIIACYMLLTAAPLAFITIKSRSIIATSIMQTGLVLIMMIAAISLATTLVTFTLLILLNGLVMLMHNEEGAPH